MKKSLFILSLLATTTFMSVSANTGVDPTSAEKQFQKHFAGAENVKWSKADYGFTKVAFTWAGHRAEAYFNSRSEFAGAIRGIFYSQLPLTVIRAADDYLKDRVVLEVREITNESGTFYSLTYEKKDKRYKIRLNSSGVIEDEKRVK